MKNFNLSKISNDTETLLKEVETYVSSLKDTSLAEFSQKIPTKALPDKEKISIVFAGQYSAGKSSLIKALTGEDIEISGGICTDTSTSFEWNGLEIIDTPGIHTEIHPEHDEITYKQIAEADLIIFMITGELFNESILQHFRKLAFEKDKRREIMLVVNKMERDALGNTPDAWKIKKQDLKEWLEPASTEELFTTFIDVESYFKFLKNPEKKKWEQRSNIPHLIENINKFSEKRGLLGKYTTNLYELKQILTEIDASVSIGDDDLKNAKELLVRKRRILEEKRRESEEVYKSEISKLENTTLTMGSELACSVVDKDFEYKVKKFESGISEVFEHCQVNIVNSWNQKNSDASEALENFAKSYFAKAAIPKIESKLKSLSPERTAQLKSIGNFSKDLGSLITKNTIGKAGKFGLQIGSGSNAHQLVLKVGHLFKHSFRPWEALKWTKALNTAGKVLGVFGAIISIVMQIKEDLDEKNAEEAQQKARREIREKTFEIVDSMKESIEAESQKYLTTFFDAEIEGIDNQLKELNSLAESKAKLLEDIEKFQKRANILIKEIHKIDEIEEENEV